MKITVLRDVCVGTTACIDLAPDAYELDGQGIVKLKDGFDLTKATEEAKLKALEGAKKCPVSALVVVDDSGKQIWPEK